MIEVTIGDETRSVSVKVSGKYNPDILEDVTNRAGRLYREAVTQEVESFGSVDADD